MENPQENYFKCIKCGEINLVSQSKLLLEEEKKTKWTTWVIPTVTRKMKEICARKGIDISECLLYLASLDAKEQGGQFETQFGVPGTGK